MHLLRRRGCSSGKGCRDHRQRRRSDVHLHLLKPCRRTSDTGKYFDISNATTSNISTIKPMECIAPPPPRVLQACGKWPLSAQTPFLPRPEQEWAANKYRKIQADCPNQIKHHNKAENALLCALCPLKGLPMVPIVVTGPVTMLRSACPVNSFPIKDNI